MTVCSIESQVLHFGFTKHFQIFFKYLRRLLVIVLCYRKSFFLQVPVFLLREYLTQCDSLRNLCFTKIYLVSIDIHVPHFSITFSSRYKHELYNFIFINNNNVCLRQLLRLQHFAGKKLKEFPLTLISKCSATVNSNDFLHCSNWNAIFTVVQSIGSEIWLSWLKN